MKLQIVLAILLLTVAVFASDTTTINVRSVAGKISVVTTSAVTGAQETESVNSTLNESTEASVSVSTTSKPGVTSTKECIQEKTEIVREIQRIERLQKDAILDGDKSKLKDLSEQLVELRNKMRSLNCALGASTIVKNTRDCIATRLEVKQKLNRLMFQLRVASQNGEDTSELEKNISKLKEQLNGLPNATDCVKQVKVARFRALNTQTQKRIETALDKLREQKIELQLLNPCESVALVDERLAELRAENSSILQEKISVLVGIREDLVKACEHFKTNRACVKLYKLGNNVDERLKKVNEQISSGKIDAKVVVADVNRAAKNYIALKKDCFKDVRSAMNKHPCIAVEVLKASLERVSDNEDYYEYLPKLETLLARYRTACETGNETVGKQIREKIKQKERKHASEVAQYVGELELRKFAIMTDDSLTEEERANKIAELEQEKRSLIKDALKNLNRVRISSRNRVKFKLGSMVLDNDVVSGDNLSVEISNSDGDVLEVQTTRDRVLLKSRLARLRTKTELEFNNGALELNGKRLILPDKLMEKLNAKDADFELAQENGSPVYKGVAKKKAKLFAIIPVHIDMDLVANASNGKVLKQKLPWWTIFATE